MQTQASFFSDNPEEFFADYTTRDWEVVDYQFYQFGFLPKIGFRGPPMVDKLLESGNYCTAVGAAQTVGVYIQKPFNVLLEQQTGLPCLNLGLGGGNPAFYANQPELIKLMNKGKFVVLQVMSARGQENSRMHPVGIDYVRDKKTGEIGLSGPLWMKLLAEEKDRVPGYVAENLQHWKDCYQKLIDRIKVPVLLFDFSIKPENETVNYDAKTVNDFFGTFPQFVDRPAIKDIASMCNAYVECRSDRGFPHPLISRFTGEQVEVDWSSLHPMFNGIKESKNTYYPSPEMHEDAANMIAITCQRLQWI